MTTKTQPCAQCADLCVDVVAWEVRCLAGFRPRHYKDGGFKRRCRHFEQAHAEDVADTVESLKIIGYG